MEGTHDLDVEETFDRVLFVILVGSSGSGSNAMLALAMGSMRFGQITLSTPSHCSRGRENASAMILPALSNGSYKGIWFPLESTSRRISPMRNSSMGTVVRLVDWPFRVCDRSYAKKKNALFRPSNTLGDRKST